MIKTLLFDFGDIFINLDKEGAMQNALDLFELNDFSEEMVAFNSFYEQGLISTDEFLEFYQENFPKLTSDQILDAWQYILKDFPSHRLEFIQQLAAENKYKLILLSNTNELHIKWVKEKVTFYEDFKNCFDAFYLSHEIKLRKPNLDIYQFVLDEHQLNPNEVLFIDDTEENIVGASKLGIHTWQLDIKTQDITDIFTINSHLF